LPPKLQRKTNEQEEKAKCFVAPAGGRGGRVMVQYLETALGLVPADGKLPPPRLERVR
jgi:hypothetical protein